MQINKQAKCTHINKNIAYKPTLIIMYFSYIVTFNKNGRTVRHEDDLISK